MTKPIRVWREEYVDNTTADRVIAEITAFANKHNVPLNEVHITGFDMDTKALETNEEMAERIRREAAANIRAKVYRREQYAKLKAEFENE